MPPALYGGVRLLLAGTILLIYQRCRGQSLRISVSDFSRLLPVSVCLFLFGNLLINLGQGGDKMNSGLAAILIATTPLWIGLFGMCWPGGERLLWRGWLGLVVGFAGIVITMWPQLQDGFDIGEDYASLLVLGSAAAWAVGSLLSRQLAVQLPHLTSAAYQMLLGGICQTTLGSAIGEWPEMIARTNSQAILAFTYLLIVGSLTGFVCFNWLLVHVSAAKVGTYAYVNPIIAVFIGWIMQETQITEALLAGIAVVLVGVYLVRSDHIASREIELEPD
jgi:drug/metabolite transporter (DMT)-like permease